ncbi:Inactive Phospholipid Phosphatase 7 [Manis pentadactyla]|nr:Inactive Phospholipid Phosphatase 7 [Manis pentadactyla]
MSVLRSSDEPPGKWMLSILLSTVSIYLASLLCKTQHVPHKPCLRKPPLLSGMSFSSLPSENVCSSDRELVELSCFKMALAAPEQS